MEIKRVPNSVEAENQIISYILMTEQESQEIVDQLSEEDFFNTMNRKIFKIAKKGIYNLEIILEKLNNINSESHIEGILASNHTFTKIHQYVEVLKRNTKCRKIIELSEKIRLAAYDKEFDQDSMMELEEVTNNVESADTLQTIYDAGMEYLENYDKKPQFIKSGLNSLDRSFFLEKGDLIVIGARPSIGKSAFLLQLALGYSYYNAKVVAFSLEMKNSQLIQRILANISKVELRKIRSKNLSESEKNIIKAKLHNHIKHLDFKISDKVYNYDSLKDIIRKEKKENGLDVLMVDYLQLIPTTGKRSKNEEIGDMTRELKIIAKKFDIAIVLLSQLNRGVEQRVDKRPVLSDLRDAGGIEQDVDSAMFLYRDEYYNEDTEFKDIMEILIRKQRQGEVCNIDLFYDKTTQRISDL